MHIDNKQFLELLSETSGIEIEKAEKQIQELAGEINQVLSDGEAYEIEGFGIFSQIGNRTLFIPAKELETEINFKYVGMEPIELEIDQVKKEEKELDNPFEELQPKEESKGRKRDPFAGLIEDFDEEVPLEDSGLDDVMIFGVETRTNLDEADVPGPEQWGIEAHKEDSSGVDKLFSHLVGEEQEETGNSENDFSDVFGEEDKTVSEGNQLSGLDAELSSLMSDDAGTQSVESLESGLLDDGLEDIFDDSEEEKVIEEELDTEDIGLEEEEHEQMEEEVQAQEEVEEISLEDFDDPFDDLDSEESEESTDTYEEEIIPVITNISSDIEPKEKSDPEKENKPKKIVKERQSKPIGAWLWMVLGLVVIIGTTIGLAYFSIIRIPGITPSVASNIQPTVTTVPPPLVEQEETSPNNGEGVDSQQNEEVPEENNPIKVPQEQAPSRVVPIQNNTGNVPSDQSKYGLNGIVNELANDGYTIVLFSLSVEGSAMAKQTELTNEGYRALVTPIASAQYGTLWRVSIGQFATLTDAAIAGEGLEGEYKGNYFIKKITN